MFKTIVLTISSLEIYVNSTAVLERCLISNIIRCFIYTVTHKQKIKEAITLGVKMSKN